MTSWYKLAQAEPIPYKVIVYDNYGKGTHTPSLLVGQHVDAFSDKQAFVKAFKSWPRHLLLVLEEHMERGITVKFVPDKEEQQRRAAIKSQREEKEKGNWWND